MTFNIGDKDGAQALDINQGQDRWQYSVKSGCAVSINSGTLGQADTLTVAAGEIIHNGSSVSVASQSVQIDAANLADPRKDVVYLDSTGTAAVAKGTAEAATPSSATRFATYRPAPSDLSATQAVVLAEVWVPTDASSITASDLRDRRVNADLDVNSVGADNLLGTYPGKVRAEGGGEVVASIDKSKTNPVNDAITAASNAGGGRVTWSGSVNQADPIQLATDVDIEGTRGDTSVSISSTAGSLITTGGNTIRKCSLIGIEVLGQGAGTHTADAIDIGTGGLVDCTISNCAFSDVAGRGIWFGSGGSFQTEIRNTRFQNIDAGNETAVFEWDGANDAPTTFHNTSVYPTDTSSATDSRIFGDSETTAGRAKVSLSGYLNIGGTAGGVILRRYNEYAITAAVNWEPGTQNTTPNHLFNLTRDMAFKFNGSLVVDGTTGNVYRTYGTAGGIDLPEPTIASAATVNGDLLEVSDQANTIEYGGPSADVNNTSGATLSPGVACRGDLTLKTSTN